MAAAQLCLDDPGTPVITMGHCPQARSQATVRGMEGSDALLAARLAAGDDLAVRMLPYAAARTGLPAADVHLVLTGPGGGTWDVVIGPGPGPEGVAIVTDAVDFCLLAANRVTADDLDLHVTGDPGRAAGVLAAASTLALD